MVGGFLWRHWTTEESKCLRWSCTAPYKFLRQFSHGSSLFISYPCQSNLYWTTTRMPHNGLAGKHSRLCWDALAWILTTVPIGVLPVPWAITARGRYYQKQRQSSAMALLPENTLRVLQVYAERINLMIQRRNLPWPAAWLSNDSSFLRPCQQTFRSCFTLMDTTSVRHQSSIRQYTSNHNEKESSLVAVTIGWYLLHELNDRR